MSLMMFTMGLTISKINFLRILAMPKVVLLGLSCQLLMLPALGLVIVSVFAMSPELSLGFLVICACPGGVLSNYVAFKAHGNVALSISLTLFSSIVTVFSIPLIVSFAQDFLGISKTVISLPLLETMFTIAKITLLPIALGMLVKHKFSAVVDKLGRVLSSFCSIVLVLYILYLWVLQKDSIVSAAGEIGLPVMVLVVSASSIVYLLSSFLKVSRRDRATLVIETGIQNSALAFTVTAVLMNNLVYAIPTVFYSVAMFIPALILIFTGRKHNTATASPGINAC
jgi:BASS family bile acid:Na+ symporter